MRIWTNGNPFKFDADYRMTEGSLGGWELQYRDPCRGEWHVVAMRPTAVELTQAYERICEGETVEIEEGS